MLALPPQHLAIILDGNRRWAAEKGLPKLIGHTEGAKNIRRIAQAVLDEKIPHLTLYILSTENLHNRSEEELAYLFDLFGKIVDYLGDFLKNDVQLRLIGDISKLPQKTQQSMLRVVEETKHNRALTLTLAANYGGRDEITRALQRLVANKHQPEEITEKLIASYLDTAGLPDVDLVIRTGGDQRLSNYLPWQSTYAELYFIKTKWPDFSPQDLQQAIEWFLEQKRNKGK